MLGDAEPQVQRDRNSGVVRTDKLVRSISPGWIAGPSQPKPAILYLHGFIDYFFQEHAARTFNGAAHNFYALDLRTYGRSLNRVRHPNICLPFEESFPEIGKALDIIADEGHTSVVLKRLGPCLGSKVVMAEIRDGKHDLTLSLKTPRELCLKTMVEWAGKT